MDNNAEKLSNSRKNQRANAERWDTEGSVILVHNYIKASWQEHRVIWKAPRMLSFNVSKSIFHLCRVMVKLHLKYRTV